MPTLHGRGQCPMRSLPSLTGNRALLCFSIVTRSAEVVGRRLCSHVCMRRKLWVFGFGSWSLGLAINCAVREHLFLLCDPPGLLRNFSRGLFGKCGGEGHLHSLERRFARYTNHHSVREHRGVAGLFTSVPKPNKALVRHGR